MSSINQRAVSAAIPQLRAEIEALPKDSGGKRQGIPQELKQRIADALAESQMPVSEFAAAVSVSISAVTTWSKRLGKRKQLKRKGVLEGKGSFRRMSVVAEADGPTGRFTIEGPNGIKMSGLGAEDVARLWRALC